jgi:hypothetical protein
MRLQNEESLSEIHETVTVTGVGSKWKRFYGPGQLGYRFGRW